MPTLFERFNNLFRTPRDRAKPKELQGVPGFAVYGGYVQQQETNAKLLGTERWRTASDLLTNVSVIAASLRFMLNLIARPAWSFEPADDSAEAEKAAEFMESILEDMETSWTATVRKLGMFRYHGFAMHEWQTKKREDGLIGFATLEVRPPHTIRRWDLWDSGNVRGVWQTSPQDGQEIYLPREKVLYLVDDNLTDKPDGLGWFRQMVDPAERLKSLLNLEAIGYERDLRGLPVGRVPITRINEMVKSGQYTQAQADAMIAGMTDFCSIERKTNYTAIVLDSKPWENTTADGKNQSNQLMWDLDLLTGDPGSLADLGKAINRLGTDIALIMGTDVILTGRDGEGSRALSEDKSRNLYLNANSILCDIAEATDRDIVGPIWTMNGLPDEMRPKAKVEDVSFKEIEQITRALADMADAGAMFAPDDEAFDHLRDLMGLPAGRPIDLEMLEAMRGRETSTPPKDPTNPDTTPESDKDEMADEAQKAMPRPLYVRRNLLNGEDLIKWAKAQGFETTVPAEEMHVTILSSKSPVDPIKMGEPWPGAGDNGGKLKVGEGGPRAVEPLGPNGAVVLLFASQELVWRHDDMIRRGASHDWDDYQPHVTITYKAQQDFDVSQVEPYRGALVFGPEIFEDLNEDWKDGLTEKGGGALGALPFDFEKYDPNQPRWPKGDPRGGQWRDMLGSAVAYEVAPNPDNAELTERWDSLSDEEKALISKEISDEFTPEILKSIGVSGESQETIGGFEGHINPAYMVSVDERPFDAAGALGRAYSQKAMVVVGNGPGPGLSENGMASVVLPGASAAKLRSIQGNLGEIAQDGWTYHNGRMQFLNFSGKSDREFAEDIDSRLGGRYEVLHGRIFSAYIEEKDYVSPRGFSRGVAGGKVPSGFRERISRRLEEKLSSLGKRISEGEIAKLAEQIVEEVISRLAPR